MKKITSWVFLLALACAVPMLAQTVTFTATPIVLQAGVPATTITWNSPGSTAVDIHIGSPTGATPFGTDLAPSGSALLSASWVVPGLTLYLVDHTTSSTLASLTLTSSATITLTPIAWTSGLTSVTVNWNAPGYSTVDVHTGSAAGPLFAASQPATGSAVASGATVVPFLSFYLVDHVSGTFLASVSLLGDWDIPAADQSNCLPYVPFSQVATAGPQGYVTCLRAGYLHWYTINGGWSTGFTLTNPTSSDIAVQVAVEGTAGLPYTPSVVQLNGAAITLDAHSSATGVLPKHGTLRFVMPSTGAAVAAGQILVQVEAKDAPSLNTIQAVEDYTYTSPADVVYSTVTVPISWVDQANIAYSAFFEESSTDSSYGGFAVKDMSGAANTVDMKVFDVNGNLLIEKTQNLAANQTWANNSDPEFGASTFTSLPSVPIVRIQFTGTGPIAVLVLQGRGQTVSTIPAQPVLAP